MHLLLAHQGGWDEALMIAVPVLAAIGFVVWAERKARSRRQQAETDPGDAAPPDERPPAS